MLLDVALIENSISGLKTSTKSMKIGIQEILIK